ncbi:alpha/beta hydrolase [Sporosarcina obsidiansis]|uniref:alpha/beta hydrolase n=1 Tax=Sporosarcina obsidiansis TaxID=2660748 RepID=UPI00129A1291|nr:alpha/beta hydrolase [Sporosarcina obsidiansis]
MEHIFYPTENAEGTLIALHGTGGNEHSLLPIVKELSSKMNYLGIRGNIEENGMPRFFRRIAEGVFDMEDLRFRTEELAEFIKSAANKYDFSLDTTYVVGYSNGANIAANLMLSVQDIAKGAILLHPMVPSRERTNVSLHGKQIFISAGTNDPLVSNQEVEELYGMLVEKGALTTLQWEVNGHSISLSEIEAARDWLLTI